jgi:hypothetical protein
MIDLRLGRWEDVLADVDEVDLLCTDPPFSERTHKGHDVSETIGDRRGLGYGFWSPADVFAFVDAWYERVIGWFVAMTDHMLAPHFEAALAERGRYVFPPLPFVSPGSRVRLAGDGPSCWTTQVVVARPKSREFASWGTLPGAYVFAPERGLVVAGGKPHAFCRALIRDYSRPGDLVCDPCAGGGNVLRAAIAEGRRAIGAEMDPETHSKAIGAGSSEAMEQTRLL